MSRSTKLVSGSVLALASVLAACGQSESAGSTGQSESAVSSTQASITQASQLRPPPFRRWVCQIIGKDGDVFGNFTGTGRTQEAAENDGLAACKAARDYASCWVNSCRFI